MVASFFARNWVKVAQGAADLVLGFPSGGTAMSVPVSLLGTGGVAGLLPESRNREFI